MKTLFQVSIKRTCREQYKGETQERDLQWTVSSSEGTDIFERLDRAVVFCDEVLRRLDLQRNGE